MWYVLPGRTEDLDDVETATAVATQHDVVISTTLGYHTASAHALQEGLAQRKRTNPGREPWFIHTSGTSNVGSRPVSGAWLDNDSQGGGTFDDVADDIYGYEVARNAKEPYIQRTTELAVVDAGLELDVRTRKSFLSTALLSMMNLSGAGNRSIKSSAITTKRCRFLKAGEQLLIDQSRNHSLT